VARVVEDRAHMQSFWDARARENAMYFVDNNVDYNSPDAERFWAEGERAVDTILEAVGAQLRSEDEVVEIGCGVGRLTRALAGRVRSVTALDVSAEMLGQAREANAKLENVRWVHGDGTSLAGIDDASADACFSHVVFQHIPDPQITLGYVSEMGRVLRPGGWSVFQISNDPSIHRPRSGGRRLAQRALAVVGRAPQGQDDPAWLGSAVDLDDLRATAESAGMRVENVTGAGTQFCFVLLRKG
jgi:SAM-dependent methyltransferase